MKSLTLACLLLSICATSSIAGPASQSNRQASGESKCGTGFKECKESLNDFKEAGQFMRLKSAVLADLNRGEKSRSTKPEIAPVRYTDVNRQKDGSGAVGPIRDLPVQATIAIQPVSLESAVGTPNYKRMP
jgi:hypothetical protein